jgi:hypothetical protein
MSTLEALAGALSLGQLLEDVRSACGNYDLVDHWQQGEFHHDVVLRLHNPGDLPGPVLVVATNCNGGVKEVLCLGSVPERGGLWRMRCPQNSEFVGAVPTVLARSVTTHWFDPCELLLDDARSELRPEYRVRQAGGGWVSRSSLACGARDERVTK